MNQPLEVVVDVICPWCFIGKRRLDRLIESTPLETRPVVEWRPYELEPDMPVEGADRETYRSRRFGSLETSRAMDARARSAGQQVGIEFRYDRMTRTPNTLKAHRLIWFAHERGIQSDVVDAIFRAYFQEGKDIGDTAVLSDVAANAGLDRSAVSDFLRGDEGANEVRNLERQAREKGVRRVPTAIVDGIPLSNGIDSVQQFLIGESK